jgi:hypothetical protein
MVSLRERGGALVVLDPGGTISTGRAERRLIDRRSVPRRSWHLSRAVAIAEQILYPGRDGLALGRPEHLPEPGESDAPA